MNGEGSGEVYGEVIKKHLTIGRADKQGEAESFGEVLASFFAKSFFIAWNRLRASRRWSANGQEPSLSRSGMVYEEVRDGLREGQRRSARRSEMVYEKVRDGCSHNVIISL